MGGCGGGETNRWGDRCESGPGETEPAGRARPLSCSPWASAWLPPSAGQLGRAGQVSRGLARCAQVRAAAPRALPAWSRLTGSVLTPGLLVFFRFQPVHVLPLVSPRRGPPSPLALLGLTWSLIFPCQGDLGPFNPGLPVEVPLWLAINLKQRQKCRLIPPEWMDVGKRCGHQGWGHPPLGGSRGPFPRLHQPLLSGS